MSEKPGKPESIESSIPTWAKAVIATVLAFVTAGIWIYSELEEITDQRRDESQIEVSLARLKDFELVARAQEAESNTHLFEKEGEGPGDYLEIVLEADRAIARYHYVDGCISILRLEGDRVRPIFDFSRARLDEIRLEYSRTASAQLRSSLLASPAMASEAPPDDRISCNGSPGPGCCQSPHDPPWLDSTTEDERGTVTIGRKFSDGCRVELEIDWQNQKVGDQTWIECHHPGEPIPLEKDDDDSNSSDD